MVTIVNHEKKNMEDHDQERAEALGVAAGKHLQAPEKPWQLTWLKIGGENGGF